MKVPKIGIVLSYYNREKLLLRTLQSIEDQQPENIFVAVVDDGSPEEIRLPKSYSFPMEIIRVHPKDKKWTNAEVALNIGIEKVIERGADIIMPQNAETFHEGDIIRYAQKNTREYNYLTFACAALDYLGNFSEWYNHPVHRPVAYDFCASISVSNMIKLNGYDERLSLGIAYGDNYWLHRVKLLGLGVEIVPEPFIVCHQWHPVNLLHIRHQMVEKNRILYEELIKTDEIKAQRIFTNNL